MSYTNQMDEIKFLSDITIEGNLTVTGTSHANTADNATHANTADNATQANHSITANSATEAAHALTADSASHAATAGHADDADNASYAATAGTASTSTKATQDGNGNVITSTYATKTQLNDYTLESDFSPIATQVGEIPTIKSDITTLKNNVTTINGDIADIREEIANIEIGEGGGGGVLSPFEEDAADFTAIQVDTGARALAEGAFATGQSTIAGSKGFRYLKRESFEKHLFVRHTAPGAQANTTTYWYTCSCQECSNKEYNKRTYPNKVYNANIADEINSGVIRINKNNMAYRHIPGNSKEPVTTTLTATNVPICEPIFMKYRLNGNNLPTHDFTVVVNYYQNDVKGNVLTNTAKIASGDLQRHNSWVIERVNVKTFANKVATNGATVDKIEVIFTHQDDLDIVYFCTDSTESNTNVFPVMIANGEEYYIHAVNSSNTGCFGGYKSGQWRRIKADGSGTVSPNPGTPAGEITNPYTTTASQEAPVYPHVQGFFINAPEDSISEDISQALDEKPECGIITNNEYFDVPLYQYLAQDWNGPIIVTDSNGDNHTCWRLDFLTSDFKGVTPIQDPEEVSLHWEEDAPYKKSIRLNDSPQFGDLDIGRYTLTQGINTQAFAYASTALGRDSLAEGAYAVAEGRQTIARYAAHAEGRSTEALGDASHAEGFATKATNTYAHSEGSQTTASGFGAHAEGGGTYAEGARSHSEGYQTRAQGEASHASGIGTIAKEEAQTVVGKYNKDEATAMFIVGSGSKTTTTTVKENCFTTGKDGEEHYIQIGKTRFTETQLKALLDLLGEGMSGQEVYI